MPKVAKSQEIGLVRNYRLLSSIKPSPLNETLYHRVDPTDPAVIALAESIQANGVLEPIVISADDYIISGHRRHMAAGIAGVKQVPCTIRPFTSEDPRFLLELREHNRQRVKSLDEAVREAIRDMNPDDVHASLREHRREASSIDKNLTFEISGAKNRRPITAAEGPFLVAIQKVIQERKEYWPISVPQIHYALLNDPPLKHKKKPKSTYVNDRNSYNSLSDLVTRARINKVIPFHVIGNETRPVLNWDVHKTAADFFVASSTTSSAAIAETISSRS